MIWRHRKREHEAQIERAQRAIEQSDKQLAEASDRQKNDRDKIAIWRRWQRDNHFAERFERALRGQNDDPHPR